MSIYLLDVNVLIALADSAHVHHDRAHQWFGKVGAKGWATCPITENAFVRIAGNPKYPNSPGDPPACLQLLRQMCTVPNHHFFPESLSLRTLLQGQAFTHNWITDLYLVGIARENSAFLATFDRKLPARLLPGGSQTLQIIQ